MANSMNLTNLLQTLSVFNINWKIGNSDQKSNIVLSIFNYFIIRHECHVAALVVYNNVRNTYMYIALTLYSICIL